LPTLEEQGILGTECKVGDAVLTENFALHCLKVVNGYIHFAASAFVVSVMLFTALATDITSAFSLTDFTLHVVDCLMLNFFKPKRRSRDYHVAKSLNVSLSEYI
jgi:hypothetical protein